VFGNAKYLVARDLMTVPKHRTRYIVLGALAFAQALLALRVLLRLLRTGMRATAIPAAQTSVFDDDGTVTVIVPVLDECSRVSPCIEGLLSQGPEVAQILVVDGGSTDGTQELVRTFAARDNRLRLLDASPVPHDWNGKAWGLQYGLKRADPSIEWVLTIDADVRPQPNLAASLIGFARRTSLSTLSVATKQEIDTTGEGLVHPSFLATLVYRFGIPGGIAKKPVDVQANGQCFLVRRELLCAVGGFASTRGSVCEDVTLAREIAAAGHYVGFFEAGDLVSVRMYAGGWSTLREWPRSLPMRDRFFGWSGLIGLVEVLLIQAAPLPLLLAGRLLGAHKQIIVLEAVLIATRLGVLLGIRRAYARLPWTYWFSPVFDLPAAMLLLAGTVRRRYVWRGRVLVRRGNS
jgi:dolichol-phosphate mannosyltransferase